MTSPIHRQWSDPRILAAIPNPSQDVRYGILLRCPEVTFMGARNQPDFATVHIWYMPAARLIELKSLKMYLVDFRNRLLSYERLITVLYQDLSEIYQPATLRIRMKCNTRGGIASLLTISSDNQTVVTGETHAD